MKDTFTDSPEFRAVARFYGERRAALAKDAEVKKLDALRLAAERAAANGGSW